MDSCKASSSQHLERWAKGDSDEVSFGFELLAGPCIGFVLGDKGRAIAASNHLPQVGPGAGNKRITQIDAAGGDDGMNYASGKPMSGWLRDYLSKECERPQ